MALGELMARLQGLMRHNTAVGRRSVQSVGRRIPASRLHGTAWNLRNNQSGTTTGLDVARFALLSIATLPFSLWVSIFSYDYFYRVKLCRDALAEEDSEISFIRAKTDDERELVGRNNQLAEVRALLSNPPHQILVVAGTNESGKSRFVSEILRGFPPNRGVTYIQLAQMVDSLSTLTHALVRAFDLRWLQMRHSLVDVLPFAGSEILVMKERFSDRDLTQALYVITEALTTKASSCKDPRRRPVIVIDGLGEGSGWIRSLEGRKSLQRLIKWCIYITKERRLAHVVLTGNEELVISLTGQNRTTRGHVKVIGLGDLSLEQAGQVVKQEIPDASHIEVQKITEIFGGFIHDVQSVSREIQARLTYEVKGKDANTDIREKIFEDVLSARFRSQIERITAAFSKGKSDEEVHGNNPSNSQGVEDDDMDPYLDPLKAVYSEAQASQEDAKEGNATDSLESEACWTQLQLWQTLQRLVESENMTIPFADLRDDVFGGDITPLLELMNEDVLGFEVESSSVGGWSWEVKPATPALGRVFQFLITNSSLKERFNQIYQTCESRDKLKEIEEERRYLRRERQRMDLRKASLLKTAELGKDLRARKDKKAQQQLESIYNRIVEEEIANELRGIELRALSKEATTAAASAAAASRTTTQDTTSTQNEKSSHHQETISEHTAIHQQLKKAVLKTYVQEGSKDKFQRFRHAFEELAACRSGITADDVVKLIKATSGEDIDLKAAQDFIRAWDINSDTHLDYEEFVTMLLTDPKVVGTRDANKPPKNGGGSSSSSR